MDISQHICLILLAFMLFSFSVYFAFAHRSVTMWPSFILCSIIVVVRLLSAACCSLLQYNRKEGADEDEANAYSNDMYMGNALCLLSLFTNVLVFTEVGTTGGVSFSALSLATQSYVCPPYSCT